MRNKKSWDHWNVVGDKAHPLNRALFDKQNPNNKAASQEMKQQILSLSCAPAYDSNAKDVRVWARIIVNKNL